jgi:hypothetical protein
LNVERIEKLKKALPKVNEWVKKWNDALEVMQSINREADSLEFSYFFDFTGK